MSGSGLAHNALTDIDLTINEGEFLGLIGHTGSGKSTLVQMMNGLMQPSSGSVMVDGLLMSDKKQRVKGRHLVGLVFQYPEYQLFEETVAKDIAYGPRNMKLPEDQIHERVIEAMRLVGLAEEYSEKSPFELSGGEKRRAALAGIIAMRPKYLIMDEPMAGLDPMGRREILDTIDGLRDKTGCGVVMVSHSMDDIARCAQRIAVLHDGRLARVDTPANVFADMDLLMETGLDIPQMSRLTLALRARGVVDIPNIYDMDQMERFILGRVHKDV